MTTSLSAVPTVSTTSSSPPHPTSGPLARCPVASAEPACRSARCYACSECFGPLEVAYDFGTVTRAAIEAGPRNIWRYAALLPVPSTVREVANLEPGLHAAGPGRQPGRGARDARAVGQGRQRQPHPLVQGPGGRRRAGGGRASSASPRWPARRPATWPTRSRPRAARAGIRSVVLVPADLERQKIVTTAVYGGTLVAVEGTYDDVNRLSPPSWPASTRTGRSSTSTSGRTTPRARRRWATRWPSSSAGGCREQVVIPVASGSQLTKMDKAFGELGDARPGRADAVRGSSARRRPGARRCRPRSRPGTTWSAGAAVDDRQVAGDRQPGRRAVRRWTPPGGPAVRSRTSATRRSWTGIRLLARTEGIFAETAGGVTVATLRKLLAAGAARPGRRDRRLQHRRGAQDARRGGAARRAGGDHPGLGGRVRRDGTRLTGGLPGPPGPRHHPMSRNRPARRDGRHYAAARSSHDALVRARPGARDVRVLSAQHQE